ncbi:MAG: homogentisate 1,2-dioxygenase [Gammaproteobacteria bacterium]|nr:homogentisate 1,2-dioxygenase [Gammaproteobacteria bacterium]
MSLQYMPGFGNDFETESLPDALPQGQNSPQKCNYGLYAEQLSGSPFTAPHGQNERSWLYRIRPSVRHGVSFSEVTVPHWKTAPYAEQHVLAFGQYRWNPFPAPTEEVDFIDGLYTITTAGDVNTHSGMTAGMYSCNCSMEDRVLINADGELLILPQQGRLELHTELGRIQVEPNELAVLPRGMGVKVKVLDECAIGYVLENYGAKLTLPNRGPIGANCLANPRDFKTPVAAYEDLDTPHTLVYKWCGRFYATKIGHSPLDVVAWHGNYAPYKYDLRTFSPVGAVLFDHPDPSIFTVLTSPTDTEGTANIDFVIFPERWSVAEHSFRPPWFHRNIMSEFMGLIKGQYDAKPDGFSPGGMSLHNMMFPHGPDHASFEGASNAELKPERMRDTLAFMFETRFPQHPTRFAAESPLLQKNYADCWSGLEKKFDGTPGVKA